MSWFDAIKAAKAAQEAAAAANKAAKAAEEAAAAAKAMAGAGGAAAGGAAASGSGASSIFTPLRPVQAFFNRGVSAFLMLPSKIPYLGRPIEKLRDAARASAKTGLVSTPVGWSGALAGGAAGLVAFGGAALAAYDTYAPWNSDNNKSYGQNLKDRVGQIANLEILTYSGAKWAANHYLTKDNLQVAVNDVGTTISDLTGGNKNNDRPTNKVADNSNTVTPADNNNGTGNTPNSTGNGNGNNQSTTTTPAGTGSNNQQTADARGNQQTGGTNTQGSGNQGTDHTPEQGGGEDNGSNQQTAQAGNGNPNVVQTQGQTTIFPGGAYTGPDFDDQTRRQFVSGAAQSLAIGQSIGGRNDNFRQVKLPLAGDMSILMIRTANKISGSGDSYTLNFLGGSQYGNLRIFGTEKNVHDVLDRFYGRGGTAAVVDYFTNPPAGVVVRRDNNYFPPAAPRAFDQRNRGGYYGNMTPTASQSAPPAAVPTAQGGALGSQYGYAIQDSLKLNVGEAGKPIDLGNGDLLQFSRVGVGAWTMAYATGDKIYSVNMPEPNNMANILYWGGADQVRGYFANPNIRLDVSDRSTNALLCSTTSPHNALNYKPFRDNYAFPRGPVETPSAKNKTPDKNQVVTSFSPVNNSGA